MGIVLLAFLQTRIQDISSKNNLKIFNFLGVVTLFFVIFYMGFRPVSGQYFGDMSTYAKTYELYAMGFPVVDARDALFEYFVKFCSGIMSVDFFFLFCAILYIIPLYFASKKVFKAYWFYAFLMVVISMSFWAYGTNGIRNGLATSLFLFAITRDKKLNIYILLFITFSIHKSLFIPIFAYLFTTYYKNTKMLLYFWLAAIPLSLALGGFWENFFLNFGFGDDDRLTGYLGTDDDLLDLVNEKKGFRWDFLFYSGIAVFSGYYFILRKKFQDPFYIQLFNVFLIANAFWILVIRANFSNRFAYLSWFMMGFVIIYPWLKNQFFEKQNSIVGNIIAAYFIFTFVLNVIFAKG